MVSRKGGTPPYFATAPARRYKRPAPAASCRRCCTSCAGNARRPPGSGSDRWHRRPASRPCRASAAPDRARPCSSVPKDSSLIPAAPDAGTDPRARHACGPWLSHAADTGCGGCRYRPESRLESPDRPRFWLTRRQDAGAPIADTAPPGANPADGSGARTGRCGICRFSGSADPQPLRERSDQGSIPMRGQPDQSAARSRVKTCLVPHAAMFFPTLYRKSLTPEQADSERHSSSQD